MKELKFKKLEPNAILPTRGSNLSSGVDFYACNFKRYYGIGGTMQDNISPSIGKITLLPLDRLLVGTGLAVDLDEGYELQIRPRSGLALKEGITILNTPGTIDEDYHNEIGIILINLNPDPVTIVLNDRIAQGVVMEVERPEPIWVGELTGEDRGGGFGSTDKD